MKQVNPNLRRSPNNGFSFFIFINMKEVIAMEGKEVYFHEYCKTCEHFTKMEEQEPCNTCVSEPVNIDSHKPVRWKERR